VTKTELIDSEEEVEVMATKKGKKKSAKKVSAKKPGRKKVSRKK
jgi:hypothetical protein